MNYPETLEYLYSRLPAFQKQGSTAVNLKLEKIQKFCEYLGNPQEKYKIIHVAGTNGKGSSSHYLASVLQEAGYKTGLYTSPHLKDFRERFKINGKESSKEYVIKFVEKHQRIIEELSPSFFELTVAMSFQYFAEKEIEWAVIEVGLGGRLDSTNIVKPEICLITNIGLDHQDLLGETLPEIAAEKAGIIKLGIPVVISEYQEETFQVFKSKAKSTNSDIFFSKDLFTLSGSPLTNNIVQNDALLSILHSINPLKGLYQKKNLQGILATLLIMQERRIIKIDNKILKAGVANTIANTKLKGRWQKIGDNPLTICDTGHNEEAFKYLIEYLNSSSKGNNYLILAFSKDKKVDFLLQNLPANCEIYFTSFSSPRSLAEKDYGVYANINSVLNSKDYKYFANVNVALEQVRSRAQQRDFIFIGGSTYLIAELNEL